MLFDIDAIYRFLDKLNNQLKQQAEQIAFAHTQKLLAGNIIVVFYDTTTLYFEASDEMICAKLVLVKTANIKTRKFIWVY